MADGYPLQFKYMYQHACHNFSVILHCLTSYAAATYIPVHITDMVQWQLQHDLPGYAKATELYLKHFIIKVLKYVSMY